MVFLLCYSPVLVCIKLTSNKEAVLTEALGLTCCPAWLQFEGFTLAALQAEDWS